MKNGSIVKAAGGFADGSKSLLKNAVMAPVGVVSKIGNSISKGTLALSFDDNFIEKKNNEDTLHKPKNIGDGLVKGFSSAGTSIWSGVAGVFTKPVEGAQNDGLSGFFVGIGKGAAGLVTKTVSGTIDIVAKTTEGLDNQTKN
jgi:vacuolar protein sorting-associated protein 13A/C